MIYKVQEFITKRQLFSKEDVLLLAISGGPDSVCLFFILKELGYKIEIAHCNFNLRDEESNNEECFVIELAKKYNIPIYVKSFETQKYAAKNKISIQMASRELRYQWFEYLLEKNNLDFLITAHHRDDNIETFLINLIRGTGINGLSGIKPKNKNIIRPFIEINKDEIIQYLDRNNIIYCKDSSNLNVKYLRNKVRNHLIPILKEINPSIQKTILDEISILNGVNKIFQKQINYIKSHLLIKENDCYKIKFSDLIKEDDIEIILFEILAPFGFFNISQILNAIKSQSGKRFLSTSHQLIIDRQEIIIALLPNKNEEIEILNTVIEIQKPIKLNFTISEDTSIVKDLNIAKLDFNKLIFPLKLRKWKKADRFIPLGMTNFKKLSDFFIDQKYSILDKQNQWILCSGKDIVWIVGERIDDRYKVGNNTKKAYIARLLQ